MHAMLVCMAKRSRPRQSDPLAEFHERAKWSTFTATHLWPPVPRTQGFRRGLVGFVAVCTALAFLALIVEMVKLLAGGE